MSSQWIDANGDQWRFSNINKTWQKKVGNTWKVEPLPPGGLQRTSAGGTPENVIVVETMGPRGPKGDAGPPGPAANPATSEVLPAESQNGINTTFSLSGTIDLSHAIQVFRNGLLEIQGHGYLVTPNTVTFTTPPLDSDVIAVIYQKAQ